ncbi:MAG: T9SS type A sorting domain-containing protein [Actinomycetes bacterium]
MKKLLLTITIFSTAIFTSSAQITITDADIATPNHVVYQANDTLPNIIVGTAGATSQTWNMNTLAQHTTDTLNFIPYAWQPNVNYPTSNLVVKQGWANQYSFADNNSTSFSFLGNGGTSDVMGTTVTINQINTPAEKVATFPFTYNSNFVNDYTANAKFYFGQMIQGFQVDSVRDKNIIHKTVVVDAWGNLTTPLGTYPVIRSTETKISIDSVFAFLVIAGFGSWNNIQVSGDSVVTYSWWANGVGFPLVTATTDSLGDVTKAQWLLQLPALGINEFASGNEGVFPNPAQNEINFITDETKQKSVHVFDVTGRKIDALGITTNQTSINTSAYANGLYTYSIIGNDNAVVSRGKFSIAK